MTRHRAGSVVASMGLEQFERRLERMVEGAFAKAFRGQLQPVELGRRLTREMDLRRAVGVRGVIAPNHFDIFLATPDYERFESFGDVLNRELVEAVREHATGEHYLFLGPIEIVVHEDPDLSISTFAIESEVDGNEAVTSDWLVLPDGQRVSIGEEVVTIGRLPECAVVLDDANVSRRHAQLRREGNSVVLVDLGSTNGTKVNGVLVRERRLTPGDTITVGTTTMRFEPA
ncbi:MAG: FhaA domain-containing protein [Acidimicrobiales bacterium]